MSRNYLESFAILIITFGLGFFLVMPKYQELQTVNARIKEKKAEIAAQANYYAGLEAMMSDLDRYHENLSKIDAALPEGLDAPAVMNFVQAAAMQAGLALQDISYTGAGKNISPVSGTSLPSYEVSLKASGSYGNFKNFLSIVERSSRLISVISLSVNAKSDISNPNDGANLIAEKKESASSDKILDYEIKISANYYDAAAK